MKHVRQERNNTAPTEVDSAKFIKTIPIDRAKRLARGALQTAAKLYAMASVNKKASVLVAQLGVWFSEQGKSIVMLDLDASARGDGYLPEVDMDGIAQD